MSVVDILESAQYVVDKQGQQTAVLLDMSVWHGLQQLLEELQEDEGLGKLMAAVQEDEKFEGEAAQAVYKAYLLEAEAA
ncbi:MAG: hypothetical protein KJZ86_25375 [Caldilineaceae bacterium]|nr:hypothetical protein [Caldilineaceae bacterium]HRJ43721.1 hypothetical protein [Caldilineaceae bacterium]